MNVELFTVLDQVANRFLDPFTGPTIEFGIRGFKEACETEGHQFRKFPEDFVLYHIGTFDADSGRLEAYEPRKIGMATSFVHTAQLRIEDQIEEQA